MTQASGRLVAASGQARARVAPPRGRRLLAPLLAWLLSLTALGCTSPPPNTGELVVAVVTDMAPPKDFDWVDLDVSAFEVPKFHRGFAVGGAGDERLPATLGIVGAKDPSTPVRIRVASRLGGEKGVGRTVRDALVTIVPDRTLLLHLDIDWLCLDHVRELPSGALESTCPSGQTCRAGQCVAADVDPAKLPRYTPAAVYGGGTGPGASGSCFDAGACFATGAGVTVSANDCSIARPAGIDRVNVALVLPHGAEGVCNDTMCLIPLDQGDEGWRAARDRILLPQAVCDGLATKKVLAVAITTACVAKTAETPTCGLWSSVTKVPGTFKGPGPKVDLGDAGNGGGGGGGGGGIVLDASMGVDGSERGGTSGGGGTTGTGGAGGSGGVPESGVDASSAGGAGGTTGTGGATGTPPDLVATSVACAATQAGSTVACSVSVKNQGAGCAAAFTNTLWLSSNAGPAPGGTDVSIGTCAFGGLAAGTTTTLTCTGTVPDSTVAGLWYVKFHADSGSSVVESNESNNDNSTSFTVTTASTLPADGGAPADLVISSMICIPTQQAGSTAACGVTVNNLGGSGAPAFTNTLWLSSNAGAPGGTDVSIGTCAFGGLAAGSATTLTCTGTVPTATASGTWFIKVYTDSGSSVAESNEANNGFTAPFTVTAASSPQADLIVQSVACGPTFNTGGVLSCSVTILNQGTAAAGAFTNQLRISVDNIINTSDLLVASCGVVSLAPNASTAVTCSGTVPPAGGTTDTVQFAQSAAAGSTVVTVGSTAGFLAGMTVLLGGSAATTTSASFAQPASGANVTVNVASSGGFSVGQRVYMAGGGTYTVASIPSGTQIQVTNDGLAGNTAAGATIASSATVAAGSYYTVASVGSSTSVTLTNTGAITNIPAGISVPTGQPMILSGVYYVGAIADSGDAVAECNEANNTGATTASARAGVGGPCTTASQCGGCGLLQTPCCKSSGICGCAAPSGPCN
jgi:hypothetical protein